MITRIVASVCALCFAVPAAAVASHGSEPPNAQGPYGLAPVSPPPLTAEAEGPYGLAPVTTPPLTAKARGPYGLAPVTTSPLTAKARGPYGPTPVTGRPITSARTAPAAATARGDGETAWRIVAICEAALLAAVAFGSLYVVRRAPRVAT
jgi:hypothetical protein